MSKRKILTIFTLTIITIFGGAYYYQAGNADRNKKNENTKIPSKIKYDTNKEKTLLELLSPENLEKEVENNRYIHRPEKIRSETKIEKAQRRTFLKPEDRGESFSDYPADKLLSKLQNGNKIEQRKAAIELWNQYGTGEKKLNHKQRQTLNKEALRYLNMTKNNFEEGYLQLQRLWFLASQGLFNNLTNTDNRVSEMSARMLSLMKTEKIIEQLIKDAQKAKASKEIKKYIFALKYMQYNNPYVIKRPQITNTEAERLYKEKIIKIVEQLEKRTKQLIKNKE